MSTLKEITHTLLTRSPLPALLAPPPIDRSKPVTSAPWNPTLTESIACLKNDEDSISVFVIASLHLFNDDIGSCHDIVDKHDGHAIADYLHYLLHRREGDYWNAKWWIRNLKSEEFQSVYLTDEYRAFGTQDNAGLAEAHARAQAFVDRCEQVEKQDDPKERDSLKQMQWDEMQKVFEFARR